MTALGAFLWYKAQRDEEQVQPTKSTTASCAGSGVTHTHIHTQTHNWNRNKPQQSSKAARQDNASTTWTMHPTFLTEKAASPLRFGQRAWAGRLGRLAACSPKHLKKRGFSPDLEHLCKDVAFHESKPGDCLQRASVSEHAYPLRQALSRKWGTRSVRCSGGGLSCVRPSPSADTPWSFHSAGRCAQGGGTAEGGHTHEERHHTKSAEWWPSPVASVRVLASEVSLQGNTIWEPLSRVQMPHCRCRSVGMSCSEAKLYRLPLSHVPRKSHAKHQE